MFRFSCEERFVYSNGRVLSSETEFQSFWRNFDLLVMCTTALKFESVSVRATYPMLGGEVMLALASTHTHTHTHTHT